MSTILVVDDDPQIRSWLRGLLDAEGHQVVEAKDGNQGLACFHRVHPDLVVLDIYMPDREGLETILLLRKSDPAVKVLAISGGVPGGLDVCDVCHLGKAFGAQDTLMKPFSAEEFRKRVERLLNTV